MDDPVKSMLRGFHERASAKTEREHARDDLAEAVRALLRSMIRGGADPEVARRAAEVIRDAAVELEETSEAEPYGSLPAVSAEGALGTGPSFLDRSPVIGSMNPVAPPMQIELQEAVHGEAYGTVTGHVNFSAVYEGPPGCVHGGFLAAAFDEVLGITQSLSGNPGLTGQLSIRYLSPSPLHVDLVFTGRIVKIEGRKIHTAAVLKNGDTVCAESEGLFISMSPEVFERLLRIRGSEAGQNRDQTRGE
jgi:acyl-coenzyme A thioesterase PaaI-like protein